MLSFMQKALRNLLVSDDEVIPARGCSRADGVAEPTSPPAPLVCSPSQRSEFNDPGGEPLTSPEHQPPSPPPSAPSHRIMASPRPTALVDVPVCNGV